MSSASFNLLQGDPTTWGVPAIGKTFCGINLTGQLVLVNNNGTGGPVITPVVSAAPAVLPLANAAGTTTITPSAGVTTALLTVTGTARNVPIVLATVGIADGQTLEIFVGFPALDGLNLNFYNTIGTGSPIFTWNSATASFITNGIVKFVFQVSTGLWALLSDKFPAQ